MNASCYFPHVSSRPGLRALIYNRASVDPYGQGVSVSAQEQENRAWCDREQWPVAGVFTDSGRSATRYARKGRDDYARLLRALSTGAGDIVVMWESSRGERKLDGHVELRALCERHGVLLGYRGRVYDMADGDDRFVVGLDALVDEREAERTKARVMRGIRGGVALGAPHGHTPFGYVRQYDPRTRSLVAQVPDPETAPILREIVARILGGDTLHAIAADLNARGIPTPLGHKDLLVGREVQRGGWTSSKIRRVMASRSMTGVRTHLGEPHPEATWEPLVSARDYDLVAAILADPSRAVHQRGVEVRHLLSGLASCAVCGGWLRAARNRGREVYQCSGQGPGTGKGHVSRPMAPMEAQVQLVVVGILSSPALMAELATAQDDQGAAAAGVEAVRLGERLAKLEDDVAEGRLSGAAFGRIEKRLSGQIAAAKARAVPRSTPPEVSAVAGPDAAQAWDDLVAVGDVTTLRRIIRALVRITVYRNSLPHGTRRYDPSTVEITRT